MQLGMMPMLHFLMQSTLSLSKSIIVGAVPVLKELVEKGHKIILYTMRSHPDKNNQGKTLSGEIVSNDTLQDAINWFKENGIPLWGINENPKQKEWTSS
jgi:hypothetical protein